jgi:L-ascorbate metabolism protein UlaG (beta-lactamase superfamily)
MNIRNSKETSMRKILLFLILASLVTLLHAQSHCKITYVSNEGFLIQNGDNKVLVDALFDHIDENWCDSPNDTILDALKYAKPPFNNVDLIAVTHKHRDHFNADVVVSHMLHNKYAYIICPEQVGEILIKNENYKKFADRVTICTPGEYCDEKITVNHIPLRICRLEHSHYMEEDTINGGKINRHRNIENLGYVFDLNGMKIFHCGDSNSSNEKEYSTFNLQDENIDIAFLEQLFFEYGKTTIDILNKYIAPKQIVLMHIHPKNKPAFTKHFKEVDNVTIFQNKMDSIVLEF